MTAQQVADDRRGRQLGRVVVSSPGSARLALVDRQPDRLGSCSAA
jgi:hypothetical protein